MGFLDVDDVEGRTVLIILVELVEGGNLPPERRSGIAPKDEHDGFLPAEGGELNAFFLVVGLE